MKKWIVLTCLSVFGCGSESSLPVGEVYEDVYGDIRITIRKNGDLEFKQKNTTAAGTYTFDENDHVRIETTVFGSVIVQTLALTDDGLQELNGTGDATSTLYHAGTLEAGRCQHLEEGFRPLADGVLQRIESQKLSEYDRLLQKMNQPTSLKSGQRPRDFSQEQIDANGYFALKITRKGCPKILIWDSANDPDYELLSESAAQKLWEEIRRSF